MKEFCQSLPISDFSFKHSLFLRIKTQTFYRIQRITKTSPKNGNGSSQFKSSYESTFSKTKFFAEIKSSFKRCFKIKDKSPRTHLTYDFYLNRFAPKNLKLFREISWHKGEQDMQTQLLHLWPKVENPIVLDLPQ